MANFDTIKTAIDANINTNGNQAITGSVMNSVLKQMVDSTDAELTELESKTPTTGLVFDKIVSVNNVAQFNTNIAVSKGTAFYLEIQSDNSQPICAAYFIDSEGNDYSILTNHNQSKNYSIRTFEKDVTIVAYGISASGDGIIDVKARYSIGAIADIKILQNEVLDISAPKIAFSRTMSSQTNSSIEKTLNVFVPANTKVAMKLLYNTSQQVCAAYFKDANNKTYSLTTKEKSYVVYQLTEDTTFVKYGINTEGKELPVNVEFAYYIGEGADILSLNTLTSELDENVKYNESLLWDVVKGIEDNFLEKNYIEDGDAYINTFGQVSSTTLANAVAISLENIIPVAPGEIWHYIGSWGDNSQLGYVWGYSDKNYADAQILVPCVKNIDSDFIIPEGVNYILAWGVSKKPLALYRSDSSRILLENIEKEISHLSDNSFEKVRISDNLFNPYKSIEGYYVSYKTGEILPLSTFSVSDYIDIEANATYVQNYPQQVAFYDADKNHVGGQEVAKYQPYNSPSNAKYIRVCFPTAQNFKFCLNKGEILIEQPYMEGYERFYVAASQVAKNNEIVVVAKRNQNDFNSIRELMQNLPASEDKRFLIYIPKGRWFECDIVGNPYIRLVGEDKDSTILYCDGTSQNLTPEDYSFSSYAGMALSEVPRIYKHCVNAKNSIYMENMTIECNDGKYCVHVDTNGKREGKFKHCKFNALSGVYYSLGFGIWGNQRFEFDRCEILCQDTNKEHNVYIHNWNNQSAHCSLKFLYCHFNKSYASIGELGSEYSLLLDLNNCISDSPNPKIEVYVEKKESGQSYWQDSNGDTTADLSLVPYSIKINYIGTDIVGIKATNRNNILNYVVGKNKVLL